MLKSFNQYINFKENNKDIYGVHSSSNEGDERAVESILTAFIKILIKNPESAMNFLAHSAKNDQEIASLLDNDDLKNLKDMKRAAALVSRKINKNLGLGDVPGAEMGDIVPPQSDKIN